MIIIFQYFEFLVDIYIYIYKKIISKQNEWQTNKKKC